MAQLPYIEPAEADPVTKAVYDKAVARFQMVLNIFKIIGNAPEIGSKMMEIFFEILKDGRVAWPTKELVILKATKMGDCLYCVTQHEVVAERLGVSPEKQADIVGLQYRTSPHYTEAERAMLDLTSLVVLDPEQVSGETWAAVRKHFSDDQIVEIVVTIGAYLQISKFGDAMGVELEPVFYGRDSLLFSREAPKSKAAARHIEHFKHLSAESHGHA
jgi:AhpD family alkylhydroperoxidase